MDSLPQDLLVIILVKLPLKRIATSKLICKQWKLIIESKFFYQKFQSHHQNSHSMWSIMGHKKEVMAHYGCTYWGLTKSLGSYIFSFITSLIHTEELHGNRKENVWVVAYSDVGLILIASAIRDTYGVTYYVANPISREYVKIPPVVPCTNWKIAFETSGLVTQVENDVVLSYKIVLTKHGHTNDINDDTCLLIYSSETGLWSFNTIRVPQCSWFDQIISLNGSLYWIGFINSLRKHALVYHNLYATDTESDQCGVIHFPRVEKSDIFKRVCTSSQGSLMYMKRVPEGKDDGSCGYKLSVWRLKSGEWQLVSEIFPDLMNPGFNFRFTIDPSDAKIVYFWSDEQKRLTSVNLEKRRIVLPNNFECSNDGCIQTISEDWEVTYTRFRMFVLPRWLYRIPCSPSFA